MSSLESFVNPYRYGSKITLFPLEMSLRQLLGFYGFIAMKVTNIERSASRRINKMGAIGRGGTENQDFGRTTYTYDLSGELYTYALSDGELMINSVADNVMVQYCIEYCFLNRIPLLLISDIDTTIVIIESERFIEEGSRPNVLKYNLSLLEISEITPKSRLLRKIAGTLVGGLTAATKGAIDNILNLVVI